MSQYKGRIFDPWATVTLAYFLRYPNPYASHILSCDVISRSITSEGHLKTCRLLLKKGVLPNWARKFVARPEAWVVEESEVDLEGKVVRSVTKNLNHVKVLQVVEKLQLKETMPGKTSQQSEACLVSRIGWGLSKRIESLGFNKVKSHIQRSPETISFILNLMRTSRLQPLTLTSSEITPTFPEPPQSEPIQSFQDNSPLGFSRRDTVVLQPSRLSHWDNLKTIFRWR
ncbi:hypothetical protein Clacol_003784 [Clathrus columnatus]|uniref:PRELI/MSF1 domain-containing protein n=1 Tax=Clathrus columnatus TaxID=1419009 RepID=A0AAV5AAM6_9AGAM|nr:hypothetical protein Clacol_003784 [Clathrus columnatus]